MSNDFNDSRREVSAEDKEPEDELIIAYREIYQLKTTKAILKQYSEENIYENMEEIEGLLRIRFILNLYCTKMTF